jgi:hypothetical protein
MPHIILEQNNLASVQVSELAEQLHLLLGTQESVDPSTVKTRVIDVESSGAQQVIALIKMFNCVPLRVLLKFYLSGCRATH